jgi:cardiolipin synthase
LVAAFIALAHLVGALTSVKAVMETRTSQGAIAWVISLNTFPYAAVPAYWVFGRSQFKGYVVARQADLEEVDELEDELKMKLFARRLQERSDKQLERFLEGLAHMPFTRNNRAELLIDGQATFDAVFEAIEAAESYVLVQFFIIKSDRLGNELKARLLRKAGEGVRVLVLYDEVGSYRLSGRYLSELRAGGVRIEAFNTRQGSANRFQLNFRNHRKIVAVDGDVAFVGGHNVGDEYLDGGKFAAWRDTHVQLTGPVVQTVQVSFVEDWYWATQELLKDLNWEPVPVKDADVAALCLPSGPADQFETCTMLFLTAINGARERLWIASPYFVPDEAVMKALQMAALRGVDVRILIPNDPDHIGVYLSAFSYLENAERAGVKIYRYQPGFMHQKVAVVDQEYAAIGTANLDNRSFRLNFEITMLFADRAFNQQVAEMLESDFAQSRWVSAVEYTEASFPFRLAVRTARLFAPIQ